MLNQRISKILSNFWTIPLGTNGQIMQRFIISNAFRQAAFAVKQERVLFHSQSRFLHEFNSNRQLNFRQLSSSQNLSPLPLRHRHANSVPLLTDDVIANTANLLSRELTTSYILHQAQQQQPRKETLSGLGVNAVTANGVKQSNKSSQSSSGLPNGGTQRRSPAENVSKANASVKNTEISAATSSGQSKAVASLTTQPATSAIEAPKPPKPPLMTRIKQEIVHYYHGFRLFGTELRISTGLTWRFLNGHQLTRREYKQLVRTSSDLFRLIPFLVILIVPFMELTLPILLKLFPGMLPSTFEDKSRKEATMKKQLKLKLEMAKLLQDTMAATDAAAVERADQKADPKSHGKAEFAKFIQTIRERGTLPRNEEIIRFSKLFSDEMTLDNLPRDQLVALCRLLEMSTLAQPNELLRFLLRMRLRRLKADDYMIKEEGVNTLTKNELVSACKQRGMRSIGASEDRMRRQLEQWLELSLNDEVPITLLLMSRAMYIPESLGAEGSLAEVLTKLPERSLAEAEVKASEATGRVAYAAKAKLILEEQDAIKKEREEKDAATKKEKAEAKAAAKAEAAAVLTDKAPLLTDTTGIKPAAPSPIAAEATATIPVTKPVKTTDVDNKLTKDDYVALSEAIRIILRDRKILVEKEDLEELKDDIQRLTANAEQQLGVMPTATSPTAAAAAPPPPIIPVDKQSLAKASDKAVISTTQAFDPNAKSSPKLSLTEKKRKIASDRLKTRVNRMITEMNTMVEKLDQDHKKITEQVAQIKKQEKKAGFDTVVAAANLTLAEDTLATATAAASGHAAVPATDPNGATKPMKHTMIKVDDIASVLRQRMLNVPDVERERRVGKLIGALHQMDINRDGEIDAEHVVKVLTYIAREPTGAINLTGHQMALMIDMLAKEEYLDDFNVLERVEDLIEQEEADAASTAKRKIQNAAEAAAMKAAAPTVASSKSNSQAAPQQNNNKPVSSPPNSSSQNKKV